jgi:hypothetical protein
MEENTPLQPAENEQLQNQAAEVPVEETPVEAADEASAADGAEHL